ncbi:MAG: dTMP kinase [Anaerolineaceae bacterium]|nr:dTMP kinase [Anaerolineaceae bacterium]
MFITLEGPDGSGKTKQMQPLANSLKEKGYTVFTAREPGGTSIGDQVRTILMNLENTSMRPRTETLLFCAARAQLVEEVIRPHLELGEVVLLDRYADSTMAYQGYGHQDDLMLIKNLLDFATGGLKPDLTLLLDVDPKVGLRRRVVGGDEWNRLDAYRLQYHQRVRQGYLQMAAAEPARWRVIDASQPPNMVQSRIQEILLLYLSKLSN